MTLMKVSQFVFFFQFYSDKHCICVRRASSGMGSGCSGSHDLTMGACHDTD